MSNESTDMVSIKISTNKLMQLFSSGLLCVEDFQCLDASSQQVVRSICLKSCSNLLCQKRLPIISSGACSSSIIARS